MSIATIFEKLGMKPPATILPSMGAPQPPPQVPPATPSAPRIMQSAQPPRMQPDAGIGPDASRIPPAAQAPLPGAASVPLVDVVSKLEGLAAKNPEKLNWTVSIVDLLKLLDLDSSFSARKELATELSCPADKMNDSIQMNTWLHKTVLQKLAENGGNIPKELLG